MTTPFNTQELPKIYFDPFRAGGSYWMQDSNSRWIPFSGHDITRHLCALGFVLKPPGVLIDQVIRDIQLKQNVRFAGPLAGCQMGIYERGFGRLLVTESPKIIPAKPGEWPVLKQLMTNLLHDEQHQQELYLYGWIKIARLALLAGKPREGQALVLAGPPESGKSLLQNVITYALGGRAGKPYAFMTGRTSFNSDLFGSEHLVVEDEAASTDIRMRRHFGANLKQITATGEQWCHTKYRDAVMLHPFWRLSISVNDEPENLMVLPPLEESNADKLILLKAVRAPMPMPTESSEERALFFSTLCGELPAFFHWLENWEIPVDLRSARYGVKHFHHPAILNAIDALAPENRLLEMIDDVLFPVRPSAFLGVSAINLPFEGPASTLENRLLQSSAWAHEVRRLLGWTNACGTYLGRLKKKHPARISSSVYEGRTIWTILGPPKQ